MKLKEIHEQARQQDDYSNLWMVFYKVKGNPRNTGSYLVRANSKKEANNIVREINDVYYGMKAFPFLQGAEEFSMLPEEFEDKIRELNNSEKPWVHLESGT